MTILEAHELYLKHLAQHCSESTIKSLRGRVVDFMRYQNNGERRVDLVGPKTINDWIEYRRQQNKMGNGVIQVRNTIRDLFKWLAKKQIIKANPMDLSDITKLFPKQIQRPPFDYEQHLKILEYAKNSERLYYWYEASLLGWHTGMRLSDIACLLCTDIDFETEMITREAIKTRRLGKVLAIPMEPEIVEVMRRMQEEHAEGYHHASPYVFPVLQSLWQCSRAGASSQFKYICRKVGIPPRLSFHSYRHAFISRLFNAGVDAKVIQTMTGISLEILYSYVTVTTETMRDALMRSRPKPAAPAATAAASSAASPPSDHVDAAIGF